MSVPDPLKSFTESAVINDRHTEIACAAFDDRNFIAVTQYRRLGTLVSVCGERAHSSKVTFRTDVVLGKDEPTVHVFARAIAELVHKSSKSCDAAPTGHGSSSCKPLLVTLALTEFTPPVLSRICAMVENCKIW